MADIACQCLDSPKTATDAAATHSSTFGRHIVYRVDVDTMGWLPEIRGEV